MEYFKISNKYFSKIKHYKYRNPKWIKLYNDLLDDYQFLKLPDQKKYHFIALLLLASRDENKIIFDGLWISRRINADSEIDLNMFLELGFIEKIKKYKRAKTCKEKNENNQNFTKKDASNKHIKNNELESNASNTLANCTQDASNMLSQSKRESRAEQSREEKSALSRTEFLFNFKTANCSVKINQEYYDDLKANYQRVNVLQEFGKMNQWYCDHPEAKITLASFKHHVRKWMNRAQENPYTKCKHCGKDIQKPREYCYECENKKNKDTEKVIPQVGKILKVIANG
jgi:hypothetical protein